jgi:hypothetical protein
MNNELERIWKEVVMAYSGYYPSIYLQGLGKTTKPQVRIAISWPRFKLNALCEHNLYTNLFGTPI